MPIKTGMSLVEHKSMFAEYLKLNQAVGDPDSHIRTTGGLARDIEDINERAWFCCLFGCFYNVPSAVVVHAFWPLELVLKLPIEFAEWINDNWKGFIVTTERRTARTPKKMLESLMSAAFWATQKFDNPDRDYEIWWLEIQESIRHFGRYISIKFLESLYLGGVINTRLPDIRPIDGWSPRKTLAWFYPGYASFCIKGNEPLQIRGVNEVVLLVQKELKDNHNIEADMFDLEVVLCTYRTLHESVNGNYPGFSQDATLGQYNHLLAYWGEEHLIKILEKRKEMFPAIALGEIQGWKGPRKELNKCHWEYGYLWTDTVYDYKATTDLKNPIRR